MILSTPTSAHWAKSQFLIIYQCFCRFDQGFQDSNSKEERKHIKRNTVNVAISFYQLTLSDLSLLFLTTRGGGTCHVCIRGRACHVFGSEISLESHIFGFKICKHELPTFWG